MSDSIDEKVVALKLENKQFETNAKQSLGTLDALAKSLRMDGAVKGLQGVSDAAKKTDLGHLASSVDSISQKFSAMSVIAVTALATITNKALLAGAQLVKSLTISPISEGFSDYDAKLTSVQTIMNATGASLEEVSGYFDKLDTYADKTIYNLSDMTGAFAKFTNAGVAMEKSVPAIKGIANMVALAGQGANAASIAMYNLSQSIAGGFLTTTDYRSLNLANVATKEWKQNMIDAAVSAGTLKKVGADSYSIVGAKAGNASTAAGLFNEKLAEGWATSNVLLSVLGDYGDITTEIGRKALAAAQDVKSLPMMLETLKAAVGTGWTDTFEIILGTLPEAKKLFTGLTLYVGGFLDKMSDARNKLLGDWKTLGGRDDLIEGLKNSFQGLFSIIKPITDAFGEIFPAMTGQRLADITKTFRKFSEGLKLGGENADRLKRTFKGVFAIFSVGVTIIKGVVSVLFNLFGLAQSGSGGFLALTAAVGDFILKIQEWLVSSGRIQAFFATINTARAAIFVPLFHVIGKIAEAFALLASGDIVGFGDKLGEAFSGLGALVQGVFNSLTGPLRNFLANVRDVAGAVGTFLQDLGVAAFTPIGNALVKLSENFGKLRDIVTNFGFDLFNTGASGAKSTMSGLNKTGEKVAEVWASIKEAFSGISSVISPVAEKIGKLFSTITDKLTEWISGMNMQDALAVLNAAFFILMYKAIKDFMGQLSELAGSFKGIADSISGTFGQLTDTLKTMQQSVKADIILKIAAAVGILAASLWVLSTIEPARLATALGGIAALLVGLTLVMKSMISTIDSMDTKGLATMGTMVAASVMLLALAGAVLILSVAVKNLSSMDPGEMAKGLIAVGAILGALALFTKFADMENGSLRGAVALIALAGSVYLLSISVEKLGKMDVGQLQQGGIALFAIISMLTAASVLMGKFAGTGPVGLLAMAAAIAVLVPIVISLGLIPFDVLRQGLIGLGIALGLMTAATVVMGKFGAQAAPGILAMSLAMGVLAGVVYLFGNMDMMTLAQGLGALGAALTLMTAATVAMGLFGAKAAPGMLAMAVALGIMGGVIYLLGSMDMVALSLGLGAFAYGLILISAAGLAAMYIGPGLLALGTTFLMLGAAMVLAGVGFLAIATGFAALAAIGVAGFAILTTGFMGLLQLIPLAAQQIGLGIRAIAVVISEAGPVWVAAMTVLLISVLKAIENATPQMMQTMEKLIVSLIQTIQRMIPKLVASGAMMILKFLRILRTFVGPIADEATALMVAFIRAIGRNVPKLVDAGAKAIIDFLNGIARAIRGNQRQMEDAGKNIASAIVEGMVGGIGRGISAVTTAAKNLAKSALSAAKGLLGINSPSKEFALIGKYVSQGFAMGITSTTPMVEKAVANMTTKLVDAAKKSAAEIKTLEVRLRTLRTARTKDLKAIAATTAALARAREEYSKLSAAVKVSKTFSDEIKAFDVLSKRSALVAENLVKATEAVAEARKKTLTEFSRSTEDSFDNLPDINEDTKLTTYVTALQKQIVDTQILKAQLETLREMGLNEDMYQTLLSKGVSAIPFVTQILDGGSIAVGELNALGSALDTSAKALGDSTAQTLYNAGIRAAEGLVAGLKAEEAAIAAEMKKIADGMTAAIKTALGIKSPSRVFAAIGNWSVKGLAKGFEQSSALSEKAAEAVGHGTIDALRKSLTGLSAAVAAEVDVDPTIRPVLDLTAIKADANQIGSLLGGKTISVGATVASARAAAVGHAANQLPYEEGRLGGAGSVIFNQYNTSPEPLSEEKIYRNTRNQISTAKGALKV